MMSRSSCPSYTQVEKLIQCLKERSFLATGHARTSHARFRTRAAWQEIAAKLNSDKSGCIKSWQQWAKYWKDKKAAVKRKASQIRIARLTGGDAAEDMMLTDIEEEIVALMGDQINDDCDISPLENQPYFMDPLVEVKTRSPSPVSNSPAQRSSPPRRPVLKPQRRLLRTLPLQRRSHMASLTERFIAIEEKRLENQRLIIENQKKMFEIFMEISGSWARQTTALQDLCNATKMLAANVSTVNKD